MTEEMLKAGNLPSRKIRNRWVRGETTDLMFPHKSVGKLRLRWWSYKRLFGFRPPFNYLAFMEELERVGLPRIALEENGVGPQRYAALLGEYTGTPFEFVDVPASDEQRRRYELSGVIPHQQSLYSGEREAVFIMISEAAKGQDEGMSLITRRAVESMGSGSDEEFARKFVSLPHRYNQAAFEELSRVAAGHPIPEGDTMREVEDPRTGASYGEVVDYWSLAGECRPATLDPPEDISSEKLEQVMAQEVDLRAQWLCLALMLPEMAFFYRSVTGRDVSEDLG